jgi:hypothetical protein
VTLPPEAGDPETGEPANGTPQAALDVVQKWFQAVVTHPAGVAAGVASPAAQGLVRLDRGELERLVRRSSRLSAEERLAIYANAYYARLLECLGDCFPALKAVLGAEVFDGFAFDYLQRYPSRSYTLDRLGERFAAFLEETRPDRTPAADGAGAVVGAGPDAADARGGAAPTPTWPDFLIDLATLEWSIAKVFDGPGAEGEPLLAAADLPAADRFAAARLVPVPCLRLLRFRFPVNAFYTAARAALRVAPPAAPAAAGMDLGLAFPAPAVSWLALSRSDFVVRRYELSALEHALLAALLAGATAGEAIAGAAAASELADDGLAAALGTAFRRFSAAGFFRAVTS